MSQYALNITLPPVFSSDNFFVSSCNEEAHRWISAWPNWPAHALLLYGPAGSGKSHLAAIWAARAKGNMLVEDIERITDARQLLHLFNFTKENKASLLFTSAVPAAQLPFTLPDLTSRLLAIPAVAIGQPDDAVLAAAMRKQFADRQMKVDDDVIAYILPRMERSLAKAKDLVELLDREALAGKKSITIPFVKSVMETATSPVLF